VRVDFAKRIKEEKREGVDVKYFKVGKAADRKWKLFLSAAFSFPPFLFLISKLSY